MSAGRPTPRAMAPEPVHRIGEVVAEFHVAGSSGPLAAPEALLGLLRRELLDELDLCLHGRFAGVSAEVEALDLDLGTWPEDPDRDALRAAFRERLEAALAPYLRKDPAAPDVAPAMPAQHWHGPNGGPAGAATAPGRQGGVAPHQLASAGTAGPQAATRPADAAAGGPLDRPDLVRFHVENAVRQAGLEGLLTEGPAGQGADAPLKMLLSFVEAPASGLPAEISLLLDAHPDLRAALASAFFGDAPGGEAMRNALGEDGVSTLARAFAGGAPAVPSPHDALARLIGETEDPAVRARLGQISAALSALSDEAGQAGETSGPRGDALARLLSDLPDDVVSGLDGLLFPQAASGPRDAPAHRARLARRLSALPVATGARGVLPVPPSVAVRRRGDDRILPAPAPVPPAPVSPAPPVPQTQIAPRRPIPPLTATAQDALRTYLRAVLRFSGHDPDDAAEIAERALQRLIADPGLAGADRSGSRPGRHVLDGPPDRAALRRAWTVDRAAALAGFEDLSEDRLAEWIAVLEPDRSAAVQQRTIAPPEGHAEAGRAALIARLRDLLDARPPGRAGGGVAAPSPEPLGRAEDPPWPAAAGRDGPGWLAEGDADGARLRRFWPSERASLAPVLAGLSAARLGAWIEAVGPPGAPVLHDTIRALQADAADPQAALYHVLAALLDGRPLDIEAARAARGDALPGAPLREPEGPHDARTAWAGLLAALGHGPGALEALFGPGPVPGAARAAQAADAGQAPPLPETAVETRGDGSGAGAVGRRPGMDRAEGAVAPDGYRDRPHGAEAFRQGGTAGDTTGPLAEVPEVLRSAEPDEPPVDAASDLPGEPPEGAMPRPADDAGAVPLNLPPEEAGPRRDPAGGATAARAGAQLDDLDPTSPTMPVPRHAPALGGGAEGDRPGTVSSPEAAAATPHPARRTQTVFPRDGDLPRDGDTSAGAGAEKTGQDRAATPSARESETRQMPEADRRDRSLPRPPADADTMRAGQTEGSRPPGLAGDADAGAVAPDGTRRDREEPQAGAGGTTSSARGGETEAGPGPRGRAPAPAPVSGGTRNADGDRTLPPKTGGDTDLRGTADSQVPRRDESHRLDRADMPTNAGDGRADRAGVDDIPPAAPGMSDGMHSAARRGRDAGADPDTHRGAEDGQRRRGIDPAQTGPGVAPDRPGPAEQPDRPQTLADLVPSLEAVLDALPAPLGPDLRDALALVWSALPEAMKPAVADAEAAAPDAPDAENPGPGPGGDPRFWRLLLRLGLRPRGPDGDLPGLIGAALAEIVPDPEDRARAFRHLTARLGYPDRALPPALRIATLAAVRRAAAALEAERSESVPVRPQQAPEADPPWMRPEPEVETRPETATACAGLVLFHPFLKLLFQRLDVLDGAGRIRGDRLLHARAALQMLSAGVQAADPRPTDPLERILLGLPQDWAHPGTRLADPPAAELIEGLMRAVIERWGALGQTSPDGLREAFVRRGGVLRFDATGPRLSVDPGPFDMLLDRLPWSFSTVALPWMPLPLTVLWRE